MMIWWHAHGAPAVGNILKYAVILVVPVVASAAFSGLVYRVFSLPILQYGRSRKAARK
jgi:uncharacterized membrane protein